MNTGEQYRHECEVRYCLKLREEDRNKALKYMQAVQSRRGQEAANRLRNDATTQWAKGNRGQHGVWL